MSRAAYIPDFGATLLPQALRLDNGNGERGELAPWVIVAGSIGLAPDIGFQSQTVGGVPSQMEQSIDVRQYASGAGFVARFYVDGNVNSVQMHIFQRNAAGGNVSVVDGRASSGGDGEISGVLAEGVETLVVRVSMYPGVVVSGITLGQA